MKLSGIIGITSGITLGAYGIFKGLQYKQHLDKINAKYNNAVQIHHFLNDMNYMFPKENLSTALEYSLSNLKNNTTFRALIIKLDNLSRENLTSTEVKNSLNKTADKIKRYYRSQICCKYIKLAFKSFTNPNISNELNSLCNRYNNYYKYIWSKFHSGNSLYKFSNFINFLKHINYYDLYNNIIQKIQE